MVVLKGGLFLVASGTTPRNSTAVTPLAHSSKPQTLSVNIPDTFVKIPDNFCRPYTRDRGQNTRHFCQYYSTQGFATSSLRLVALPPARADGWSRLVGAEFEGSHQLGLAGRQLGDRCDGGGRGPNTPEPLVVLGESRHRRAQRGREGAQLERRRRVSHPAHEHAVDGDAACIHQSVLERQLPNKTVNLIFG